MLAQAGLLADQPVKVAEATPWFLWPDNVPTWNLWQRLRTQWRRGFDGQVTGLDYASVWAVLDGLRVRRPREVFEHLQAMERAVLEVVAKKREQG